MEHKPVLWREVLEALQPRPGGKYVDCTVGGGGHLTTIAASSHHRSQLLGIDADVIALAHPRKSLSPYVSSLTLVQGNFARLEAIAREHGFIEVDGVLFDLGVSSFQLEDPRRGFSFQAQGPLDMRMDPAQELTAWDLVNRISEEELAGILWKNGEERDSRRIARGIVRGRPIETTAELAQLVSEVKGRRRSKPGRHPATQTFQALRMAVNDELASLRQALPQAARILAPGGRLGVIAFHSLEDRIVKGFMNRESRDCLCPPELPECQCGHQASLRVLTRKPITPSPQELKDNPRSRSAKLRVAEKLRGPPED